MKFGSRAHVLVGLICAATVMTLPASAGAAITTVFSGATVSKTGASCTAQSDGVRLCTGSDGTAAGLAGAGGATGVDTRFESPIDKTPLAYYLTLPPAPTSGADGPYPLIVQAHGWDTQPKALTDMQYYGPTAEQWAKEGYAVLQITDRGWFDSCGNAASRLTDAAGCAQGFIRLDDDRFEVRDTQDAIGALVDEGIVNPAQIGVTGESYGGGLALALATLRDRVMNTDGTLSPWRSLVGVPLTVAASAPVIPWSDLVYSLVPNGRTLDYQVTGPNDDLSPIGVLKQSFVSGLFANASAPTMSAGTQGPNGYLAPAGSDNVPNAPQADITSWYGLLTAGEPYDTNPQDTNIVTQIARFHSPYYLLDGAYGTATEAPAPLLIANGFTDDLFPVDEAVRYMNLENQLFPGDPVSLFDGDFGHQPAQNKGDVKAALSNAIDTFMNYYVRQQGSQPAVGVTAYTQTCPASAPSGGPYTASSWSALHPGEVVDSSAAAQTVVSAAGNPALGATFDPIASAQTGAGICATATATDQGTGVATYRLPAASGPGYTLLGSATVSADLSVTGTYPFIAARLLDVDPSTNTETLVARGVYRIDPNKPDGLQVFQLHPGAWHFAAGHVAKLELLGQDSPYVRTSNGTFSITVTNLQLRLPVAEQPGTAPGVVAPLAPTTPNPTAAPASGTPSPTSGTKGTGACTAHPSASINARRSHLGRRSLTLRGGAVERRCTGVARTRQQRITRVEVFLARRAAHGRCRFVTAGGRMSKPRSCRAPLAFRARGTTAWSVRRKLRVALAPGTYTEGVVAVDGLGKRASAIGVVRVR